MFVLARLLIFARFRLPHLQIMMSMLPEEARLAMSPQSVQKKMFGAVMGGLKAGHSVTGAMVGGLKQGVSNSFKMTKKVLPMGGKSDAVRSPANPTADA